MNFGTTTLQRRLLGVLAVLCALLGSGPLQAQTAFPSRPVELTILWPAGTAPDVVARALAQGMSQQLGQPVMVVNKPGAGGAVAYRYVQQQKPDGYSLVLNSNSISTTFHSGTLPFNYTAFEPVAQVSVELPILVVRADSPFNDLKDMVAYAKAHPEALRVGNSGVGSHIHIVAESFFADQRAPVTHVPFASSFSVTSLLGGHLDASVTLPGSVAAMVKAGKIKVLGVFGSTREPSFPDVRTATEQGFDSRFDMWRGIAAPKGTPPAVMARLEEAVRKTVESPEYKAQGALQGFLPVFQPGPAFGKTISGDDVVIGAAMVKAGLAK